MPRCWARTLFKSARATPWRIVDVPFDVPERTVVTYADRQGKGTHYEPRMEYRPLTDQPKGVPDVQAGRG